MDMDMHGDEAGCRISMLWNWYTTDACFLASSWRIQNGGMFAASCIGVIMLVICLEGMHRLSKEYDQSIHQQWTNHAKRQSDNFSEVSSFTFRASPLQQLIRATLHAVTFGLAYLVMLIAMSYNGYLLICIVIGAGLGKFFCDWSSTTIQSDSTFQSDSSKDSKIEEHQLPCL